MKFLKQEFSEACRHAGFQIYEYSHRVLAGAAINRFHADYVKPLKSHQYYTVLQYQHLQGVGRDVVITYLARITTLKASSDS